MDLAKLMKLEMKNYAPAKCCCLFGLVGIAQKIKDIPNNRADGKQILARSYSDLLLKIDGFSLYDEQQA